MLILHQYHQLAEIARHTFEDKEQKGEDCDDDEHAG